MIKFAESKTLMFSPNKNRERERKREREREIYKMMDVQLVRQGDIFPIK